jgi:hypothetical protein
MTAQEWLDCTVPRPMLEFLWGNASDRKLRLFACGCCRRIWHLLTDQRSRSAVAFAERYADQLADQDERRQVAIIAQEAVRSASGTELEFRLAAQLTTAINMEFSIGELGIPDQAELAVRCRMLRCIIGNPFHHQNFNPDWLVWNEGTIPKLAQAIYDERAFDRLPILADALEDAGCTNPEMLNHCRAEGPHVLGCWPVDLILGKS